MSAALRMHAPTSLDIYRGRCAKLSTFQNGLQRGQDQRRRRILEAVGGGRGHHIRH